VNEDFVETTVEAVIKGARTGEIGDGKILPRPSGLHPDPDRRKGE